MRSRPGFFGAVLLALAAVGAACSNSDAGPRSIRLLTHAEFDLPEAALADYTARTGVDVIVYREDDPTKVVDLLARSRATPVADVVVGIDTLELSRIVEERLVEPYRPIDRDLLDPSLLIEDDWMTPVSELTACMNRSISYYTPPERRADEFPDPDAVPVAPPTGINQFTDPEVAPTVVIPDARTSRMGLYFLVSLAQMYPEGNQRDDAVAWPQFLDLMLRGGVLVAPSFEAAYFSHFLPGTDTTADPAAHSTDRPVTWGSTGMPAVTVRFQPDLPETVDIAVVNSGCIQIVNYAGMVAGTPNRLEAGRLLDMMVEPLFQYGIPDRFGSRPARGDILRTDAWRAFGVELEGEVLDPLTVGRAWPGWLLTWNQVVRAVEDGPEPVPPEVEVTLPS